MSNRQSYFTDIELGQSTFDWNVISANIALLEMIILKNSEYFAQKEATHDLSLFLPRDATHM